MGTRMLGAAVRYSEQARSVRYEGRAVTDQAVFKRYLREVVHPQICDVPSQQTSKLCDFASSRMATEFLERLLQALPLPEPWEVGEALAVCSLAQDPTRDIRWPWNNARDRRTPRASLPGADLVGLCLENGTALLLFGEVKTSSEPETPPSVMRGKRGMTAQIERIATCPDIQLTLLAWLQARCLDSADRGLFKLAAERFLGSEGKELLLVGVLLRDTDPSKFDLRAPAKSLSMRIDRPTRIDLIALYLPTPIPKWPQLLRDPER